MNKNPEENISVVNSENEEFLRGTQSKYQLLWKKAFDKIVKTVLYFIF